MSQAADPTTARPARGAIVALVLLLIINLFNYIDRQVLAAVLKDVEKTFFPSEVQQTAEKETNDPGVSAGSSRNPDSKSQSGVKEKLGYLQGAFMFSYFLFAPLFGLLADRFSRWKLIGLGVILWSLASGGSGLASTFVILFLTRCAVGLGEAAYGPAAPTILSDLFPVRMRGLVMSLFYVAIPVGSALGYVLGGLVLASFHDWRWAFYLVTPPGILLGVLCFFMPEPARGQSDRIGTTSRKANREDLKQLLRTRSYVLCTLGMTAMTFAMGGIAYWLPYYLEESQHIPSDEANYKFGAIVVVSGLLATILGGIAGDLLRKRIASSYFLVSGLAMLVGFPLIALVLVVKGDWIWVCIFFACFALFFNTGPTNTILANVTHPQIRASAFAINIFVIHALGDAISPAIIGGIADRWSLKVGFLAVSAFVLLGGIFWLCGMRYLARDTAAVSGEVKIA
jgi:MFS family permease